jgi:hypothetical protein
VLVGDPEGASTLYELLAPYAEQSLAAGRSVQTYGSAHHALGLAALAAGRREVAVAHFEKALVRHEEMGSPPLVALTRARLDASGPAPTGRPDPPPATLS